MKLIRLLRLHEWSRCRLLVWSISGLIGPFILYAAWLTFSWPPPLEISHEVTHLTKPLTQDGKYVDYVEAMIPNIREVDPRDDLWQALTNVDAENWQDGISREAEAVTPKVVYVNPTRAMLPPGLDTEKARHRRSMAIDQLQHSCEADPQLAKLIRENEPWYQAVLATNPGPVGVTDKGLGWTHLGIPANSVHQSLVDAFDYRMLLAWAEDDYEKAWESFQFILKVAERERSLPFAVCHIAASHFEASAVQSVVFAALAGKCPAQYTERVFQFCVSRANARFPDVVRLDSRLQVLSQIVRGHRTGLVDGYGPAWEMSSNGKSRRFENMRVNAFRCRVR